MEAALKKKLNKGPGGSALVDWERDYSIAELLAAFTTPPSVRAQGRGCSALERIFGFGAGDRRTSNQSWDFSKLSVTLSSSSAALAINANK